MNEFIPPAGGVPERRDGVLPSSTYGGSRFDSGKMIKVRPDDIRLSFNEAPDIYDKVRPSYPAALFDALFRTLPSEPEIVEVGPERARLRRIFLPEEQPCSP